MIFFHLPIHAIARERTKSTPNLTERSNSISCKASNTNQYLFVFIKQYSKRTAFDQRIHNFVLERIAKKKKKTTTTTTATLPLLPPTTTTSSIGMDHRNVFTLERRVGMTGMLFSVMVLSILVETTDCILHDAMVSVGAGRAHSALIQRTSFGDFGEIFPEHPIASTRRLSGMPVLASKYDILIPDVFYCDTSEFAMRFDISDFITNEMLYFNLSRGDDCEFDIWENTYLTPSVYYDAAPKGNGTLVRQVLLVLEPDLLFIAGSPIYSVSSDYRSGTLSFCAKLTLLTEDLTTIVNFRNIVYEQTTTLTTSVRRLDSKSGDEVDSYEAQHHRHLLMDCTGGYNFLFENWWYDPNALAINPVENVTYVEDTTDANGTASGIIIAPETLLNMGASGTPQNASFSYNLDVFECDSSNQPITKTTAYVQGELFSFCIGPDADAKSDGLYMRRIDNMYFSRTDMPGYIQFAVEGTIPDFFGMSDVKCNRGDEVCRVETIIRAEFFSSPGMINLVGTASLQFGSSSSRQLYEEEGGRNLQRSGLPNDRGQFSVLFPVGTFAETLASQRNPSSELSILQLLLLVVLSFTFMALLMYLFWIRLYRRARANDRGEDKDGNKVVRKSINKKSLESKTSSRKSIKKDHSKKKKRDSSMEKYAMSDGEKSLSSRSVRFADENDESTNEKRDGHDKFDDDREDESQGTEHHDDEDA